MSFLNCGVHTLVAYSKLGCTSDLKRLRNISLSMYVNVLKISPRFLLAIEILQLMRSPKDRDLSMITPRSFYESTHSSLFSPSGVCIV